jgi:uncharacterized protein (TIGR03437 family)
LKADGDPFVGSVANAASLTQGAIAPGEIVSIFGLPLGSDGDPAAARVLFDGVPGQVLYTSASQVNAVAPAEIAGRPATSIEAEWNGARSQAWGLPVATDAPALFTANSSGQGQAIVYNEDGTANDPANPTARGSVVELYGIGANSPVTVSIGGRNAAVRSQQFTGGVLRVSAVVPPDAATGPAVPVVISTATSRSQPDVTVAVK